MLPQRDDDDRPMPRAVGKPYPGLIADEKYFFLVSDYLTIPDYISVSRLTPQLHMLAGNNYRYFFTQFKRFREAQKREPHILVPQGDFSLNLSTLQRWSKSLRLQQIIACHKGLLDLDLSCIDREIEHKTKEMQELTEECRIRDTSIQIHQLYRDREHKINKFREKELQCGLCDGHVSFDYHLNQGYKKVSDIIQMACPCCKTTRLWTAEEAKAAWGFSTTDLENVPCWSRDRKHYSTADLLEAWRHNTMLDEKTSQHPRFKDLPPLVRLSYAYQYTKPTPSKDVESKDSESKDPAVYEFLFNFSKTLSSAIQLDPTKLIPILVAELNKRPELKSKFAHDYLRNEIQAIHRTIAFHQDEADRKLGRLKEKLGDRKKELALLNYNWGAVKNDIKIEQNTQEFRYWTKLPSVLHLQIAKFTNLADTIALLRTCKTMKLQSDLIYASLYREWFPAEYQKILESSPKSSTDFTKEFKQEYMTTIGSPNSKNSDEKSKSKQTKFLRLVKEADLPKIIQENITLLDLMQVKDSKGHSLIKYASSHQSILNYFYVQALDQFSLITNANIHSELRKLMNTTLLYWAACCKQGDTVKKLIELDDIVIDVKNRAEETPLWIAANNGHEEIVNLLIAKKASVDSINRINLSALHVSVDYGFFSTAKTLLEHKADVNQSSKMKRSPLHVSRTVSMTKLLVEFKATINTYTVEGYSPIVLAASRNNFGVVEYLLRKKADVNTVAADKTTALSNAVHHGNIKMVKTLLDACACPVPIEGSVNLYRYSTNPEVRKLLLLAELDMQIRDGFPDRADLEKLKTCLQAKNLEGIEKIKTSSMIVNDFCARITETITEIIKQAKPKTSLRFESV